MFIFMTMFSLDLGCLCAVLCIGLVSAADIPFVFGDSFSSIVNCTPSQLEDISKQDPEIINVSPIRASLNIETINISWIDKNNTNYLLPPDYSIREGGSVNGRDWFEYGNENYDKGYYNKSIECYEKAIQENPKLVEAWYNKGTALSKLGMYEEAIEAFDRALEIKPLYAKARENRGAAYDAIEQQKGTM